MKSKFKISKEAEKSIEIELREMKNVFEKMDRKTLIINCLNLHRMLLIATYLPMSAMKVDDYKEYALLMADIIDGKVDENECS